jgi:hypothetical protein
MRTDMAGAVSNSAQYGCSSDSSSGSSYWQTTLLQLQHYSTTAHLLSWPCSVLASCSQ